MKYFVLLLTLSFGLNAQQVTWDSPTTQRKQTTAKSPEYQRAYNDTQIGQATYYADYLAGKPTASGEAYRLDQLTASHALLPTGTILQVTRLDNGNSVNVRVNDNNGHSDGSLVVLSRQAAYQLGMLTSGRARVSVKRVGFSNWNPQAAPTQQTMTARTVSPATYGTVVRPSQPSTASPVYSQPKSTSAPAKPYYRPASYGATQSTPDFGESTPDVPAANEVSQDPYAYRVATSQTVSPPAYTGRKTSTSMQEVSNREVAPRQYNTVYAQPMSPTTVAPLSEVQVASNVSEGYGIQLAAYGNIENAQRQVRSLQNQGVDNIFVTSVAKPDGSVINRVMVGPFVSASAAQQQADQLLREKQIGGIVIKLK